MVHQPAVARWHPVSSMREQPDHSRENRKPMPYHCRGCRRYFSVKTNTVLQSSNLSLSKWALAYFLFSTNLKGVSSMKLHRDLGSLKNQHGTWLTASGSRGTRPRSGLPDRSRR